MLTVRQSASFQLRSSDAKRLEGALANFDEQWCPMMRCWWGNQRTSAFDIILAQIGWRAGVVEGGC